MKEELRQKQSDGIQAPTPPVRFTIDDEAFEFNPLSFGNLVLVEQMKATLKVNQRMLQAAPLVEYVIVTHRQTDDIRKIVSLLLGKGKFDMDVFKQRLDYLREHCSKADLCSLFIIGTILQSLWIKEAGGETPTLSDGLCEQDLWEKPYVELLKK